MTNLQRVSICVLGALTPIVLNLVYVDLDQTFHNMTPIAVLGYTTRVFVLLFTGGIVAFLYSDENNSKKLFHLGLAGPALLAGLVQTHSESGPRNVALDLAPVSVAIAADTRSSYPTFENYSASPTQQFFQGLLGGRAAPSGGYYVIVGSTPDEKEADAIASKLTTTWKDAVKNDARWNKYKPTTYMPYGKSKYDPVVLGANLTQQEALQLQVKALQAGMPKDTYLWKAPSED